MAKHSRKKSLPFGSNPSMRTKTNGHAIVFFKQNQTQVSMKKDAATQVDLSKDNMKFLLAKLQHFTDVLEAFIEKEAQAETTNNSIPSMMYS